MFLGTFRIGEDVAVALDVVSGDPDVVSTIQAWIVRSRERNLFSPDPTFTPLPLTIAPRAESGEIPEGWNLSLTAAQTALLGEGVYGIDAKILATGGTVDITDATALVRFTKAAVA